MLTYRTALLRRGLLAVHAAGFSLPAFAENYRLIRGRPFSFAGHEYLREIYEEHHDYVVIEKAAQMGASEFAISKAIWTCLTHPRVTCIYFFPTDQDVRDFSHDRVGPALDELNELGWYTARDRLEAIARRLARREIGARWGRLPRDPIENVGLRQVGSSSLYFRGMQSAIRMKSIPADLLIFDELDEAPPRFKPMARERLSHSELRWVIELSTPTLPDYGIDIEFQRSDQRHWHVECRCRGGAVLEDAFPDCLQPRKNGEVVLRCPKCKKTKLDVNRGRWIAHQPGVKERRGYHLSQLFSSVISPAEILREFETTRNLGEFYNSKLGRPYAGDRMPLNRQDLLECMGDHPIGAGTEARPYGTVVLGVDQGAELHIVAAALDRDLRTWRVVKLEVAERFERIGELIESSRAACCVIDGLPNQHSARRLAEALPGRVFLCYYGEGQRDGAIWDRSGSKVTVDRTETLDRLVAAVRARQVILPGRVTAEVETFIRHHCHLAKVMDEDPQTGRQRARYIRVGDDHFAHAHAYAMLAAESLRHVPVIWVGTGRGR